MLITKKYQNIVFTATALISNSFIVGLTKQNQNLPWNQLGVHASPGVKS